MTKFLAWWLVNTFSLLAVAYLLPGVHIERNFLTVLLVVLLIGVINAILRPLLYFASCGLIILTLGLIIPILNALLLLLADSIAGDAFEIDSLGWAVLAAIIMGIINWAIGRLTEDESDKKEGVYVIRSK